ncbi:carbohydrate porin [bacterium]|nr:carbohydrate porin [bacterium]
MRLRTIALRSPSRLWLAVSLAVCLQMLAGATFAGGVDDVFDAVEDPFCTLSDSCWSDLAQQPTLFGDVGGLRPALGEQGIQVNASTTQIYQGVASGGTQEGFNYGGRNDYYISMDGHKLGLWQGLLIDLHGESRYGESLAGQTGALTPVDTALLFPATSGSETALTGVKFTQILNEHLLVFAGKINVLDNYLSPFAAGKGQTQFMNTAFVLPPILGRTVPYSSLGAGFAILQNQYPIFSMMVLDPVNQPTTSGFDQLFDNGVSIFGELSLPVTIAQRPGHQNFFFSWANRQVSALDANAYVETPVGLIPVLGQAADSWSLIYAFDQYLYVDPCNPQRGWGVFGQFGLSDGNPNPFRWTMTVGVGGSSPWRSRPLDSFGIGYYYYQTSTALKNSLEPTFPIANEHGLELFYNIGITQWFHITPDLQFIEPASEVADAAVVVGLRTKIDF